MAVSGLTKRSTSSLSDSPTPLTLLPWLRVTLAATKRQHRLIYSTPVSHKHQLTPTYNLMPSSSGAEGTKVTTSHFPPTTTLSISPPPTTSYLHRLLH
uniref:Ovule protein n=1 Tax=Echinococcus granulosus TaxID=6210 RepID=A0A068X048_ECHGR|nr:hypothetical protein EgrG_002038100 [Echinococcus granulosus]